MPVAAREIENDEWVVRGIPEQGIDPRTGEPTTFYFKSGELSTWLLTVASIRHLLALHGFRQLAAINAEFCRELGLTVTHTPVTDDPQVPEEAEHVSVFMPKSGRTSRAKRLRDHAVTVQITDETPESLFQALQGSIRGHQSS